MQAYLWKQTPGDSCLGDDIRLANVTQSTQRNKWLTVQCSNSTWLSPREACPVKLAVSTHSTGKLQAAPTHGYFSAHNQLDKTDLIITRSILHVNNDNKKL